MDGCLDMRALIVSGSPHKNGLCAAISNEIANGIKEAGGEFKIISLAEKNVGMCKACVSPSCWQEMKCTVDDDALELRELLNDYDALAFVAPVYFLSVNGLSKNFMDRMRYYGENGKPAIAVSVAGGTGKGCILALQEICRWLIMLGFRPISLLPVTRYNLDVALVEARVKGRRIVGMKPQRFSNLAEKVACYESLPYMRYSMVDEILFLAKEAINGVIRRGRADLISEVKEKIEVGENLLKIGKLSDAIKVVTEAHEESMGIFNKVSRQ
ncbi:MAG: flavodoxin family protein [Candidatus Bathyarchaeia archaeon]